MAFPLFRRVSVRGFTLVELSMCLAIMGFMMAILLYKYPETAMRLSLANATHTTALLIREAQVRGSAVDSVNSSLGGYGVYIDLSIPNQLKLFGDTVDSNVPKPYGVLVGDGLYQTSPVDETKVTTTFPNGYVVAKACITPQGQNNFVCNSNYSPTIQTLTISFTRPNPQPTIYINGSKDTNFSAACIELHSPSYPLIGHYRSILVYNSGVIRTQVTACN